MLYSIPLVHSFITVKPVLSSHSKKRPNLVFNTDCRLMQVKSIAECSKGSILQYFRPSLSYHLSLRSLFCLFLSGRLRQALLHLLENHRLLRKQWIMIRWLQKPPDLDLHCFQKGIHSGSAGQGLSFHLCSKHFIIM